MVRKTNLKRRIEKLERKWLPAISPIMAYWEWTWRFALEAEEGHADPSFDVLRPPGPPPPPSILKMLDEARDKRFGKEPEQPETGMPDPHE